MNHALKYCSLYEGRRFTVQGSPSVYVKIADSHAVNERTRKDAIFALREKCTPCGNNKKLLHTVLNEEQKLFRG